MRNASETTYRPWTEVWDVVVPTAVVQRARREAKFKQYAASCVLTQLLPREKVPGPAAPTCRRKEFALGCQ